MSSVQGHMADGKALLLPLPGQPVHPPQQQSSSQRSRCLTCSTPRMWEQRQLSESPCRQCLGHQQAPRHQVPLWRRHCWAAGSAGTTSLGPQASWVGGGHWFPRAPPGPTEVKQLKGVGLCTEVLSDLSLHFRRYLSPSL